MYFPLPQVRNDPMLCPEIVEQRVLQSLMRLIQAAARGPALSSTSTGDANTNDLSLPRELPRDSTILHDSSIKIALFSLGNMAVHEVCNRELKSLGAEEFALSLMRLLNNKEAVLHRYAQRLLQKLVGY
jgi:hypothetical protein